ncbi:2-dehydro-3-deoxygalactonokinase [Duganella sp. PWIR1]
MSRDDNGGSFVGVNWGSTNFRAYRIAGSGELLDEFSRPAGVAGLKRPEMEAIMNELMERWPDTTMVYASGMIGSNIGWAEVPYAAAPADIAAIALHGHATSIGRAPVHIVPGVSCRRGYDGGPDIMRGEEIELFGFAALEPAWNGLLALPGTHTKWARFEEGRITGFFTSMSGEIYDRLTAAGLLASIVEGEASDGPVFQEGVQTGLARQLGMATLLFGARARVMHGMLSKPDAASYLRGLLIGSEIADARAMLPDLGRVPVPLIGSGPVCKLYAAALVAIGAGSYFVDSRTACIAGFHALHRARIATGRPA